MNDTKTVAVTEAPAPVTDYRLALLLALTRTEKHVYGGTKRDLVPDRKRRNKEAKLSRRRNRP